MYVGGGEQWDPDDRMVLEDEGRKPYELNEIFDAVNAALGHQINNRVDIAFRPRGMGADDEKATSPGDVLRVTSTIKDIQPSRSKSDRGMVTVESITTNQHGERLQKLTSKLLVFRKPPSA